MKAKSVIVILSILITINIVYGAPTNDSVIYAEAGNVTQLSVFDADSTTSFWQGYYGNVSGTITLGDANNYTMYSWIGGSTTTGEIYATNETVKNWAGVECINLSTDYRGFNCQGENEQCLNITEIEDGYGMQATNADGFDETFNETLGQIQVGTVTLSDCSKTDLFVNGTRADNDYWNETVLTINDTSTIIYASIINSDTYGYNNQTWDFQMIVADNPDVGAPTKYYIYTELT